MTARDRVVTAGRSALLVLSASLLALRAAPARADEPRGKVTYVDHVAPILEASCTYCHDAAEPSGGLDLTSYAALMSGGGSGAVIAPGDPQGSRLFRLVTGAEKPFMPDDGSELSTEAVATLRRWIAGGALETSDSPAPRSRRAGLTLAPATTPTTTTDAALPGTLPLLGRTITSRLPAVLALAASPTAPLVAVAGHREVLLFDGVAGDLVGALPFPAGRVHAVRFTPDGRLLLAAGGEGAARGRATVYEVATGLARLSIDDARDALLVADLREDHARLAVGGPTREVDVYDTATGERVHRLAEHTDWVTALAFSPDGVLLVSADRAGGVHVWEADSGREYLDLEAHGAAVTAVAWRRDSDLLATAAESGHVRLFQALDGKKVKEWVAHPGGALGVTFLPDGRLVTTGRDRKVALWKADGAAEKVLGELPDAGLAVAAPGDGARAFAGDFTGRVHAWSLADAAPVGSWAAQGLPLEARLAAAHARGAADEVARWEAELELAQAFDALGPAREAVAPARGTAADARAALEQALAGEAAAGEAARRATSAADDADRAAADLDTLRAREARRVAALLEGATAAEDVASVGSLVLAHAEDALARAGDVERAAALERRDAARDALARAAAAHDRARGLHAAGVEALTSTQRQADAAAHTARTARAGARAAADALERARAEARAAEVTSRSATDALARAEATLASATARLQAAKAAARARRGGAP